MLSNDPKIRAIQEKCLAIAEKMREDKKNLAWQLEEKYEKEKQEKLNSGKADIVKAAEIIFALTPEEEAQREAKLVEQQHLLTDNTK